MASSLDYGVLSILPSLLAIVLAIRTKQVYLSLILGIFLGWLIISDWNLIDGIFGTVQGLVDVFSEGWQTKTIMFSALVGALILFVQKSGGVNGFVISFEKLLTKLEGKGSKTQVKAVQLFAWLTGIIVFVETSISSLTVGTIFRPVFDKLKISREKLAYIADSSSAPSSILIPLNAWGATIMGLLYVQGDKSPLDTMLKSLVFNFYPMIALLLVAVLIIFGIDYGPMEKAERRVKEENQVLDKGSMPMVTEELVNASPKEGIAYKAMNMIVPIATMIALMPVLLAYTGWEAGTEKLITKGGDLSFSSKLFTAIGEGSGSTSVLMAVTLALLVAYVLYGAQKIFNVKEMIDLTLKGISELMPLALLMMMAFAISSVTKELKTGEYIANVSKDWLTPEIIPFAVFLISCFIAFATGTSFGTFGIMIPIVMPLAAGMDANVHMALAATLGGAVFGDHSSPISDTTIISSMASATDHIDHVKTQLPYALTSGIATALIYLVLGFVI